ncbi:YCF48-related protein [Parendozoicomonas sp. Alg238-R29]|uniref:WD40/YVTN/BNR-like repeat-containing protein n=1 Tax=Parendozoicomonas sp. Alg238-R29 TaxID=2993446 RepID=UPI00248DEA2E|nr:YCF48-related protein [Parendozoicomonas sp. Alg238-R29]
MKFPSFVLSACSGLLALGVAFSGGVAAAEPASEKVLSSLFNDIERVGSSQRLVAVGDRGYVLWSDDMGKEWKQTQTPSDVLLTAVDFPSDDTGYAVGHDAEVFKSQDGGQSWKRVYQDKEAEVPLLDVFFTDNNNGFAIGAYGYLVQTTDGGKTWHDRRDSIDNEDEFHFNAMTRLKDGTLVIAGEAGTLYRSTDGGKDWETLESPYEGSFFGVQPLEQLNAAVAYGLRGNAFITTDSGKTWAELDTGTDQSLYSAVVLTGNQPLLVGSSGTFALNDGDDSLVANQSDRAALTGIVLARDNMYVVTGDNGIKRVSPGILGQ